MADQRFFAIRELTGDRAQRYVTIDAVAEHLRIKPDEAERIARGSTTPAWVRVGGSHDPRGSWPSATQNPGRPPPFEATARKSST
jgi:hypothetical protein